MSTSPLVDAIIKIESCHFEEALHSLEALAKEQPEDASVLSTLGYVLEKTGRLSESKEVWAKVALVLTPAPAPEPISPSKVVPSDPDSNVVTETWARILAAQNLFSDAREVYIKLAQKHPDRNQYFMRQATRMDELMEASAE